MAKHRNTETPASTTSAAGSSVVGNPAIAAPSMVNARAPRGDQQAILRAEQAVYGSRRGSNALCQPANRLTLQASHLDNFLGCFKQRGSGLLVVLPGPSHR